MSESTTKRIAIDNNALRALLRKAGACEDSRSWASKMDLRQAWTSCERGDWLLWLAARLGVDRKRVVLAACRCARLALPHVKPGEDRPRKAIETAEAWCRGEATIEHVRSAADAAYAAGYASAHAAAADAADAADDPFAATWAAAHAADAADDPFAATWAAAHAADAAGDDARTKTQRECADVVRRQIPYRTIAAAARRMLKKEGRR